VALQVKLDRLAKLIREVVGPAAKSSNVLFPNGMDLTYLIMVLAVVGMGVQVVLVDIMGNVALLAQSILHSLNYLLLINKITQRIQENRYQVSFGVFYHKRPQKQKFFYMCPL
jgi:hypothetical protein